MATARQSSSYKLQKEGVASMGIFEKLGVVHVLLTLLLNVVIAAFTGFLRSSSKRPKSYYRYVALTALRTMGRKTTVRQQHFLGYPTDEAYLISAKKNKYQPETLYLEDGTAAHWVGISTAKKLIINFHGGGYTFPASPDMFDFMYTLVTRCNENETSTQGNVACLFLAYDLAGEAKYPRQLQQASALLDHVINKLNFAPRDIIITGDSAGGNLVLALLSHINHPHPSTTIPIPKLELKEKLAGAVLISPWVDFDISAPSITTNQYKDCIPFPAITQWSTAFMGTPYPHLENTDYYNQAITAPASWWNGLAVEGVLIVAGEEEVLIDGIKKFETVFTEGIGKEKVKFFIGQGEYHDQHNFDPQIGVHTECEQGKLVISWIASKF